MLYARKVVSTDEGLQMRQLSRVTAYVTPPRVGRSASFDLQCGGRQGGVETPEHWKTFVEYIIDQAIRRWFQLGWGFKLSDGNDRDEYLVNHVVPVDNIVLFSSSVSVLQMMVGDLDKVFGKYVDGSGMRYFQRKPASLELMCSGTLRD